MIAFDQPLYALAKQVQWNKYVFTCGGLFIETAALKTLGVWLRDSGWVQVLVQVDITSPGIADSISLAIHVAHTKIAHQVRVAAIYILKHCTYDHYCMAYSGDEQDLLEFQQWCKHRENICPHFQY